MAEENKGFFGLLGKSFSQMTSAGSSVVNSIRHLGGKENLEVINPEGGENDAEEEADKGRFKKEERDGYFKMMSKYIGADVTSMVTLPVLIFEPMTMLQKMAELMEYSELLNEADKTDDPNMRMVYAVCWAVSVYHAYSRTWKPFNPILGETYELANHNGVNFLSEQVSHHPPMSAGHAENEHFIYDCTSKLKTKYLGNSLEVYPVGRTRIELKRTGQVLELVPPPTKVLNLIFGRTWVDSPGDMILTNSTTGDKVVLYFQPCGWFGSGRFEVDGYVYNGAEEPQMLITGNWNSSLSCQPCNIDGDPIEGTKLLEVWRVAEDPKNDKFQFTYFANKINSFETAPKGLLPSDSRLRPDRSALESGDMHKSGLEKARLEERQRAEKREREKQSKPFVPRWFKPTGEILESPWNDTLEVFEFKSDYKEYRERAEKEGGEGEGEGEEQSKIQFNPWQFNDNEVEIADTEVQTGIVANSKN